MSMRPSSSKEVKSSSLGQLNPSKAGKPQFLCHVQNSLVSLFPGLNVTFRNMLNLLWLGVLISRLQGQFLSVVIN